MNLKLLTIPCLWLAASFASPIACLATDNNPSYQTLTLEECLAIALTDNPTVKIADMEVERVDYSRKETIGQLLPTVSFGGTYNRTLAKQVAYMNLGNIPGLGGGSSASGDSSDDSSASTPAASTPAASAPKKDTGFKMGLDNSYQLGFSASVPLIAPQLWKTLNLTDSQILINLEQARASRLNLINSVKNAYYGLLLAEDSKKVIQESYDMAALTHDIYSKKYSLGAASDYDVLRTSVAMKNIEPEMIQADIAVKQARLQLLILLGLDINLPVEFAGELKDYEATMYERTLSLSNDYTNNSSLVLNTLQTRTLAQTLDVQKAAWYPTLALSGSYYWTSSSDGNPLKNFRWNPYSFIGLSLNVPLFQGGQRYYKVKQAQIQLDEMKWQRENLERSISMQADLAMDNIKKNVQQISSATESVSQAERAHDIMQKSFDIGAASYLDLRDSELSLTRARLSYYQSIYNLLVAEASLELILGNAPIENYDSNYTNNPVYNKK